MDELARVDATAQADAVRRGDVEPLELVEAAIARVEARNPALNAVIHERFDHACDEARHAPDAPFRGVPIVVKDLDGPLGGEPHHLGNRLMRDLAHVADHDSYLIARLRAAGFVVIGKTNVPELGLLPTTEPSAYGPTRNPWDPSRSPGGSSGGTAAAVASGMVALGHAGDGGGSIRIPASMCGLVGLKPTRGRVSLGPDDGEVWSGLVVRHVLTRSVRDSAAVLDVLAGAMPGDPSPAAPPSAPFADALGGARGRLRIGVRTTTPAGVAPVDQACAGAVELVARVLEREGHVVELAAPASLDEEELLGQFMVIAATAVARDLERIGAVAGREVGPDDVERLTWAYAELAAGYSAAQHAAAVDGMHAWTRRTVEWWTPVADGERHDLLLTPTVAALPPAIGEVDGDAPDPWGTLAAATPFAAFTLPFNMSGQPAVSIPATTAPGPGGRPLPVGIQLVAAPGREDVLLCVAAALEASGQWVAPAPDDATDVTLRDTDLT
jgi:amidase